MLSPVQFTCPVMSNSLWPHGQQHTRLAQTNIHWVRDGLQQAYPVIPFSSCLQSCPASVFFSESVLHIRWPKYWSFSFSNSPSNEYAGLISFRMDWLDLLAVQGILKGLFQYHSSKASILQCSAFVMVQLSLTPIHDYWRNHSFDYVDLCWQSNVSAF